MPRSSKLITVGWQEWLSLPDLEIPIIKAKIDTGATTSSLGVTNIQEIRENNKKFVQFKITPLPNIKIMCIAEVIDERIISDSGGHRKLRYVIKSTLDINNKSWPIEITLANRKTMKFQLLLGREAMEGKILVDPAKKFLLGKHRLSTVKKFYLSD